MARSRGEAAAQGLESGFLLGRNTQLLVQENERRDRLDQEAIEDRRMRRAATAEALARQKNKDRAAAIAEQRKNLVAAQQAIVSSGITQTPEEKGVFMRQMQTIDKAENDYLREVGGVDLERENALGQRALEAVGTTPDGQLAALPPGTLQRAVAFAGKRPTADYLRGQDGSPSLVEKAGASMLQGMQSGDLPTILQSANVLYAPSLRTGVGEKSPHGGTIVGKEIVGLTPAPGSTPEDPAFIPTLRVYVSDGSSAATDMPFGATGSYVAPLTEDRSSGNDSKVKRISQSSVMETMGHNLHVAELLNDPAARQKLEADRQGGGFNEELYLAALARYGIKKPVPTIKQTVIPRGGTLLTTETDPGTGKTTTTQTKGEEYKTRQSPAEEAIDLFERYPERFPTLAAARAFVTPSKAANQAAGTGGGSAGSGGSGEGGSGLSKEEDRLVKAEGLSIDRALKAIDRERQRINDDFKSRMPKELSFTQERDPKAVAARDKKVADLLAEKKKALDELNEKERKIEERSDKLDERLSGKSGPSLDKPKKAGTASAPAKTPAGAKDFSSLWK